MSCLTCHLIHPEKGVVNESQLIKANTFETCTSCHATWRQHVVDDATWQQLTASTPPPGMHQGHAGHTP